MSNVQKERFEDLPKEVQEDIELGWKQLRAGQGIPHDEVIRGAEEICRE